MIKQTKDLYLPMLRRVPSYGIETKLHCCEIKAFFFFSIPDSFQPGKDVVLSLFKPFFPNRNQHENNESQKDSIYFNSIISDDKK